METPLGRSRGRGTPGSARLRSAVKTPKSVLTPNDDAAEKASARRKRRSEALRLSLSDAFSGHADQQGQQQKQQQAGASSSKPVLSEQARNALLEQCLKLATENKITDGNAWHLDLIQHLPDIVSSGPGRGQGSSGGYNFQKMSGGLDAGVTIYAKRVELTYKSAFSLGMGPNKQLQGDDGQDGYEADEDGDMDDAAAAASKAQKKGKARQGGSADEEATLTTPDHLRAKKGDNTFAVDPLFHTMSALFDEGGAKGLLLLNRSVFDSAHVMVNAQDIPEQQFLLQPQPQPDFLLDLRPLQQQLAACSSNSSASQSGTAVLTPGLHQLYAVLEDTRKTLPGQQQQQGSQSAGGVEVASIMQQALRGLPPTPMPRSAKVTHAAGAGAAGAQDPAAASADDDTAGAGCYPDHDPCGSADAAEMQCGDSNRCSSSDDGGGEAAEGPLSGSVPVVASFLASYAAASDEEAAATDADGYDGYEYDESGHPGCGDDGHSGWNQQQQLSDRRPSLLGLGAGQDHGEPCGLDAEALEQLLGAAAGGAGKGGTTAGTGWAGSRFWKYRSAAAAAARMAAGSSGGGAVKRAAGALSGGRKGRSAGPTRIDFTVRPAGLSSALAPGDPKKTRLVTAPSSSKADTLLPEDLHYQASHLLQLFLRPSPISFRRQQQQSGSKGQGGGGQHIPAWTEEGDSEGVWDGDDGCGDDYDAYGSGGDGYNAGDLSAGDPGFSGYDAASGSGNDWWSADGELLSAPNRSAGGHVRYQRSAKQVDVRALKDLLWHSLVTVNGDKQTNMSTDTPASHAAAAAAAPVIPFQDVIVSVPSDSAAGALEDVSVHMCFICLLHLANEKGLVVRAHEDLTTLTISNVQQQQQQQEQ